MKALEYFFGKAASYLWGNWMLAALLGLGLYYTVLTGFVQVRYFPYILSRFAKDARKKKGDQVQEGKYSSYQALCTAIASCVGSGNIVGVSTAILAGGPGALFWMWAAAFLGMATKFGEITLGMRYHGVDKNGEIVGGPMYYIAHAWKMKWVGVLVAVLLFIQNAGATLIQSNTISGVVKEAFSLPHLATGILLAAVMTFVISGGFRRLVHAAEKVVPVMAGLYVFGGLVVLLMNITRLPQVLVSIFQGAFTLKAGTGAAAGLTMKAAMRYGIARGLYSNEAGEGSAAVIHSSAQVDHPARQGLYGIIEVFIDTMVICSTTGFAVLLTGAHEFHGNASTLAAAAFGSVLPGMDKLIYISLILFAGTSMMSQWYFGHVSLTYLNQPKLAALYRMLFPLMILFGSLGTIELVWSIQDCALGLLILPNIIALLILGPEVRKMIQEFALLLPAKDKEQEQAKK